MDISLIWQTVLIFIMGTLILRVGGRKSIAEMTIAQTIVVIALGTLLIEPVSGKGLQITFILAFVLIFSMIIVEYLQVKVDFLETLITGKALIVIENGEALLNNLKKLRMTIDQLETRLRQAGITTIKDVKYATIEVSGQLGYELKDSKKPLIKDDLLIVLDEICQLKLAINSISFPSKTPGSQSNIFKEIQSEEFEGNHNEP